MSMGGSEIVPSWEEPGEASWNRRSSNLALKCSQAIDRQEMERAGLVENLAPLRGIYFNGDLCYALLKLNGSLKSY